MVTIGTDYTISIDSDISIGYTAQAKIAGNESGTITENINVVFQLTYERSDGGETVTEYTYTVQSAKSGSTTISGIDSEGNAPTKVTAWVVRGDFDPAHFQANFTNGTVKVFNRAEK